MTTRLRASLALVLALVTPTVAIASDPFQTFAYKDHKQYDVSCIAGRECSVTLMPGDQLNGGYSSDTNNWEIHLSYTGDAPNYVPQIVLKPQSANLHMNFVITAKGDHKYFFNFTSTADTSGHIYYSFATPAPQRQNVVMNVPAPTPPPLGAVDLATSCNNDTFAVSRPTDVNETLWIPTRVCTDGAHTYIQETLTHDSRTNAPIVKSVQDGTEGPVNYGYDDAHARFVVDGVYPALALIGGTQKKPWAIIVQHMTLNTVMPPGSPLIPNLHASTNGEADATPAPTATPNAVAVAATGIAVNAAIATIMPKHTIARAAITAVNTARTTAAAIRAAHSANVVQHAAPRAQPTLPSFAFENAPNVGTAASMSFTSDLVGTTPPTAAPTPAPTAAAVAANVAPQPAATPHLVPIIDDHGQIVAYTILNPAGTRSDDSVQHAPSFTVPHGCAGQNANGLAGTPGSNTTDSATRTSQNIRLGSQILDSFVTSAAIRHGAVSKGIFAFAKSPWTFIAGSMLLNAISDRMTQHLCPSTQNAINSLEALSAMVNALRTKGP